MIAWLQRLRVKRAGRRYLARRQRGVLDDQHYADELQAARDGLSPRPYTGA
ncbi:MAG: hypothetical protein JWR90_1996 [Marmoricola sp.]|jgi:hypothetical protein|nr:hypothetical protein [Marmoricola sp.]